jgi:D-alanine-D-alanine ligase
MSRTRVVVLFGGVSSEHEISLRSAASVIAAIDRARYEPILVGIARDGTWRTGHADRDLADIVAHGDLVHGIASLHPDLVFPVLHGPHGEDGTMQGLLEIANVAYVGSGVLASALCMDKVAQKHLVASAAPEIPLVPWRSIDGRRLGDAAYARETTAAVQRDLGVPCFVKPANLGSSVGVEKVTDIADLLAAAQRAAQYDHTVVVERGIDAREIEIAVLGDGGPDTMTSLPGEIVLPPGVWYDYETKYINDVASYAIPAELSDAQVAAIRASALAAFRVTGCHGLARIDFLLDRGTGVAYLNELNTMPGFTSISMYPKLMAHAGLAYPELVDRLCTLALARHRERSALRCDL